MNGGCFPGGNPTRRERYYRWRERIGERCWLMFHPKQAAAIDAERRAIWERIKPALTASVSSMFTPKPEVAKAFREGVLPMTEWHVGLSLPLHPRSQRFRFRGGFSRLFWRIIEALP